MLKTLLMARFGLRAHAEPRPTDVYELVVGRRGHRMREVPAVNELEKAFPPDPSRKDPPAEQIVDSLQGRRRSISTGRGLMYVTEQSRFEVVFTSRGTWEIDATRITMAELSGLLSGAVDRPVIDKTQLTGLYQLRIEIPRPAPLTSSNETPVVDPSGVSVSRAVEELGLELEPRRIPLDTIVVNKLERTPTDN